MTLQIPATLTQIRHKDCPKVKIFFVGVPKTGTKYFLNTICPSDIRSQGHGYFKNIETGYGIENYKSLGYGFGYGNASSMLEEERLNLEKIGEKIVVISIIRNPYSMLYSLWKYGWSRGNDSISSKMKKSISFEEFVRCLRDPVDKERVKKLQFTGSQVAPNFSRSLYFQLFDNDDLFVPDFVIRMENMSFALSQLEKHLGIRMVRPYTRDVTSEKVDGGALSRPSEYKEHYTDDLSEFVSKRFERELSMFGYDIDGSLDSASIISGNDINGKGEQYIDG